MCCSLRLQRFFTAHFLWFLLLPLPGNVFFSLKLVVLPELEFVLPRESPILYERYLPSEAWMKVIVCHQLLLTDCNFAPLVFQIALSEVAFFAAGPFQDVDSSSQLSQSLRLARTSFARALVKPVITTLLSLAWLYSGVRVRGSSAADRRNWSSLSSCSASWLIGRSAVSGPQLPGSALCNDIA